MIKPDIILTKTNKVKNALAVVKLNQTLWCDDDEGMWDCDKPDTVRETLPRNRKLYIKHNVGGDINEDCKYIACNGNGIARMGFYTLKDAIDWGCFDILEFTEECKKLYLEEVQNEII